MKLIQILLLFIFVSIAQSATLYSNNQSFMGSGSFYGPGSSKDYELPNIRIDNIVFSSDTNFITPFINNAHQSPNICAEQKLRETPSGVLSDGKTRINENIDICPLRIANGEVLFAVVDGGPQSGELLSVALEDGNLVLAMDAALDLGSGAGNIIKLPLYGTTGTSEVPYSLQSQLGRRSGDDFAGPIKSGNEVQGRIGDYNNDGFVDGAFVFSGNIPLSSSISPGAPYAFIMYFEMDIPYSGKVFGKLPEHPILSRRTE